MHRFIKAVGAGAKRARALDREEARDAFRLIVDGRAEPLQVGAFLLALRMKGETADELAGFADALGEVTVRAPASPPGGTLEVDAHGDGRGASLLPAAACAAAALGTPVCLAVERGSRFARHGLDGALAALGLDGALDPGRAVRDLARAGIAACDLALACPPLGRLVALRPLLGVRTVTQTLAKLVSPLSPSTRRLLGVFHAPYLEPTAEALGRLGGAGGLVAQALGGLPEARPGKIARVASSLDGVARAFDLRAFAVPAAETAEPPRAGEDRAAKPPRADEDRAAKPPRADEDWATKSPRADDDEAPEAAAGPDAAFENRAALDGASPAAHRAAAAAALIMHAATGADPASAAAAALAALLDGRAKRIAARLR